MSRAIPLLRIYYFYLVFFDSSRKPVELLAVLADQLYRSAEMQPSSYEVRFDRKEFHKAASDHSWLRVFPTRTE